MNDNDSAGRPNYAHAEFERDADAEGLANSALARAMGRLLKANRIHVETFGPPSRRCSKLTPGLTPETKEAEAADG